MLLLVSGTKPKMLSRQRHWRNGSLAVRSRSPSALLRSSAASAVGVVKSGVRNVVRAGKHADVHHMSRSQLLQWADVDAVLQHPTPQCSPVWHSSLARHPGCVLALPHPSYLLTHSYSHVSSFLCPSTRANPRSGRRRPSPSRARASSAWPSSTSATSPLPSPSSLTLRPCPSRLT